MFYSKSNNGFYSQEIHGDNIPSDSVEISQSEYSELMQAQSEGKRIGSDAQGNPKILLSNSQSKESRIESLQSIYESDMDKLNKAWLSSLISNEVGQATRQAAIKSQMAALSEQLDADILAIIMEQ